MGEKVGKTVEGHQTATQAQPQGMRQGERKKRGKHPKSISCRLRKVEQGLQTAFEPVPASTYVARCHWLGAAVGGVASPTNKNSTTAPWKTMLLVDEGLQGHPGFPDSSVGKESACNAGDPGLIPGSGRSTGEGIVYPLQYSSVSLVAQLAKNPPVRPETWVRFLG